MDYKFEVRRTVWPGENNVFTLNCVEGTNSRGEDILLHNEIDIVFKVMDGEKIYILEGWHIGTESYDLDEGDDYTLERFHPGITKQIIAQMKENKLI